MLVPDVQELRDFRSSFTLTREKPDNIRLCLVFLKEFLYIDLRNNRGLDNILDLLGSHDNVSFCVLLWFHLCKLID